MLYASQHLSLACLEVLVHLDKSELPPEYVLSTALLSRDPDSLATSAGTNWAEKANLLAVSVRSAVIPDEFNILVNPNHPDYRDINWSSPGPFGLIPGCSPLGPSPTNEQPLYFPGILCPELPVMTANR